AHVGVADVDLRHGASAGAFHHDLALFRVLVDADFLDVVDTALFQQHFGAYAIRAHGRAVHDDVSHWVPSWLGVSVLLRDRQAGLKPGAQAAFQTVGFGEALFAQAARDAQGFAALFAIDNKRFVLGQRIGFVGKVGHGNVAGLGDAACLVGVIAADIDENTVFLVGQLDGFGGGDDLGAALEQAGHGQHDAGRNGNE